MAQIKRALEFNFLILFNKLKIFFIAMSKFLVFPAQRAEKIPGRLSKASTSRPESSDIQIKPLFLAAKTDLILAFSLNVLPFSTGSFKLKSFGFKYLIFLGKISFNSLNVPGVFVAMKIFLAFFYS